MNQLGPDRRARVVAALIEGNSIRSTVRMTGVAKNTVVKLLVELGQACARHHDETVRGLRSQRIQCDEIWSYVYAKAKNLPADKKGVYGYGDAWTWTAMDADSKLMISYMVGPRVPPMAYELMKDLSFRLSGKDKPQLTTDGLIWYAQAIEYVFGIDVDYATVDKNFSGPSGNPRIAATRYSPGRILNIERTIKCGMPDREHISTSFVERQNLTMRMSMRRFTRLTNGFSKKLDNMIAAVALHFTYYNFARVHQTLRVTPAMEAGLTDHVWTIDELVALLA